MISMNDVTWLVPWVRLILDDFNDDLLGCYVSLNNE